jgi:hypothetical protein
MEGKTSKKILMSFLILVWSLENLELLQVYKKLSILIKLSKMLWSTLFKGSSSFYRQSETYDLWLFLVLSGVLVANSGKFCMMIFSIMTSSPYYF